MTIVSAPLGSIASQRAYRTSSRVQVHAEQFIRSFLTSFAVAGLHPHLPRGERSGHGGRFSARRHHGTPSSFPRPHSPYEVDRIEPLRLEKPCRLRRARAHPAHDEYRLVARYLGESSWNLHQRDVQCALDVTAIPLVLLADVQDGETARQRVGQ